MNNIIAFHGADHRCGTTQIAQCCAEYLAENTDYRILLIFGSNGRGSEYCEVCEPMDYIRPYLAERILNVEDIKKRAFQNGNLFIIGGHETPETADLLSADMAETLVKALRSEFDLILIDTGSHIELGYSFGFLFAADEIYMLINQRESSFRNLEWEQGLYTKLNIEIDHYVINKYEAGNPYDLSYISERLMTDRKKIYTIRRHRREQCAEMDSKSLLNIKGSRGFEKDIKKLAEDIAAYVKNEV